MRQEFAPEARMAILHHSEHSRAHLGSAAANERLPLGQSIAVIAGLSALSWAVLILIIVAIRTLV
jgi:hypothetical protein